MMPAPVPAGDSCAGRHDSAGPAFLSNGAGHASLLSGWDFLFFLSSSVLAVEFLSSSSLTLL